MMAATFLATFVIPMFYDVIVEKVTGRLRRGKGRANP
jgi:hypothetical protein